MSSFIKKREFEFELSLANTVGFIPMNLGKAYGAINQTDACYSLKLTPSARPILPLQPCTVTNTTTAGNRFNANNLPHDLKVHVDRC